MRWLLGEVLNAVAFCLLLLVCLMLVSWWIVGYRHDATLHHTLDDLADAV